MRFFINQISPPFLKNAIKLVLKKKINFYDNWELAKSNSKGYDDSIILERVYNSSIQVLNGEKVFERDGIVFEKKEYNWILLSAILYSFNLNKNHSIIDFGGSLGSTYFQNKIFFNHIKKLKWLVVEQNHFVNVGKKEFENQNLLFFNNLKSLIKFKPETLLLSSVIHYLEKPYQMLEEMLLLNSIKTIIIDRTPFFLNRKDEKIIIEKVNVNSIKTSYPHWIFNLKKMICFFENYNFDMLESWDSMGDSNKYYTHKGFILQKNTL